MPFGRCLRCGQKRWVSEEEGLCFDCLVDEAAGHLKISEEEKKMANRGVCAKCGREMSIKARGLCGKCYQEEYGSKEVKSQGIKVILDFGSYPELYEALQEKAREEFRDISHQILWCVRAYLEKGSAA